MDSAIDSAKTNIRDLVDAVKSGEKDKASAIHDLEAILRSSVPATTDGTGQTTTEGDDNTSGNSGRISQEDRRVLINKLLEKKRQARAQQDGNEFSREENDIMMNNTYSGDATGFDDMMGGEYDVGGEYMQYQNYSQQQRPRSASAQRTNPNSSFNGYNNSYFTRRSADDSLVADARTNRIAQTEAAIRHEMFKDCTFQPRIKDLPSHYGTTREDEGEFYDRVTKWQKEKDAEGERRHNLAEESLVEDCTFKPKINRNSLRAVKEIRGDDDEDPADRLYKNHEISILQRSKFIEEELARERELEVKECTFEPHIGHNPMYSQVRSKLSSKPKNRDVDMKNDPESKRCTFAPKVKGITPNMKNAKEYVNANVVDRLTRPLVTTEEAIDLTEKFDRPVMDVASFMGKLRDASATPRTSVNTEGRGMSETKSDAGGKRMGTKDVEQFLGRMEQAQLRRDQKVEVSKASQIPKYQPRLCKKSIELSTKNHRGQFLDRLERDNLKRADHELRAAVEPDLECTFKPEITKKSAKYRPRTTYEMSKGDLLKKENNSRMMRLRSDQEEIQELTFKPAITKKADKVGARSKISIRDSEKYLQMHKERADKREEKRKAELERRESEEVEKCSFQPVTKECPAYVRRIAKSMSVVRAARSQDAPPADEKPTWK